MPPFTERARTYRQIGDLAMDLCQGDVIQPTDEVQAILSEVHPHFTDPKYTAFLVLTQTCDLVRRDEKPCKSRYINLAVVRPLKDILLPLLDRECGVVKIGEVVAGGIYHHEAKSRASQLLSRIFNQNAQSEGIFYLHPDADVQIAEPSAALLQVCVAVRSHEHYTILARNRSGGLQEQFQSKLGWLLGNLFSRVATIDWDPSVCKEMIRSFLDGSEYVSAQRPHWVAKDNVNLATQANADIQGKTLAEIVSIIEQHRRKPPRKVAIERVVALVAEVLPNTSEQQLTRIQQRLSGDGIFTSACKQ